jgi:hypothetical protein
MIVGSVCGELDNELVGQKKKSYMIMLAEMKLLGSVVGFTIKLFERSMELWNHLNIYNVKEKTVAKRRNWHVRGCFKDG